jgi:hypothetical protein
MIILSDLKVSAYCDKTLEGFKDFKVLQQFHPWFGLAKEPYPTNILSDHPRLKVFEIQELNLLV